MKENAQFQRKIERNVWEQNLDEVVAFIKSAVADGSDWSWAMNTRCKYIELRIDMRDGGFLILDRDGKRISFDQLKWQYGKEQA